MYLEKESNFFIIFSSNRGLGRILEVSKGINCHEVRTPLGVVAAIVPFNFPVMVPMWTIPIALVAGNTVICKPSEKVPSAMQVSFWMLVE